MFGKLFNNKFDSPALTNKFLGKDQMTKLEQEEIIQEVQLKQRTLESLQPC